jgi:hypothetical protein
VPDQVLRRFANRWAVYETQPSPSGTSGFQVRSTWIEPDQLLARIPQLWIPAPAQHPQHVTAGTLIEHIRTDITSAPATAFRLLLIRAAVLPLMTDRAIRLACGHASQLLLATE